MRLTDRGGVGETAVSGSAPSVVREPERPREQSAATVHVLNKAELQEAFGAWVEQHGYIWFDADLTLATSLASYLGISDFKIDGVRV